MESHRCSAQFGRMCQVVAYLGQLSANCCRLTRRTFAAITLHCLGIGASEQGHGIRVGSRYGYCMDPVITLTGEDLPLSPVFIEFLARFVDPAGFSEETWFEQLSEQLSGPQRKTRARADVQLQGLALNSTAQAAIASAYGWFRQLAASNLDALRQLHARYQFIPVIGIPRSGGSYLIAELFSALGYEPSSVPAVIAHDGFPEAGPTVFMPRHNGWLRTMQTAGEYIAMLELFFANSPDARRIVPKKLTKAIYAAGFFRQFLSPDSELVVTIRHPLACCISTYEKSGGLPPSGAFPERSTIEHWIRRDLRSVGSSRDELATLDYFSAYVRYWEHYYTALAMSGLIRNARTTVICFGAQRMQELAAQWHIRFASGRSAKEFLTRAGLQDRHPQWLQRSGEAIARVGNLWRLMGIPFPAAELNECL